MTQSSRLPGQNLPDFLENAVAKDRLLAPISAVILALSQASLIIAGLASQNGLGGSGLGGSGLGNSGLGRVTGSENSDGDQQKALDIIADELICTALNRTDVAVYLSEERDRPVNLQAEGDLICACDPLDGSSNIDTNQTIGTIFSIYRAPPLRPLAKGREQIAAGFFAYGQQTALILTIGAGTIGFCLDGDGNYQRMEWQITIPSKASEFAINAANNRHWHGPVARYIADLLAGDTGPRGRNFNMRWAGSLIADAWRIYRRGGIFLYPQDRRKGYEDGRLRLVYEANPIAFLTEQAGGKASDGRQAILDIEPEDMHQRTPLLFGSSDEVDKAITYSEQPASLDQISLLFGSSDKGAKAI